MKVLDDKDLEIARLTGKVEALESELAKERAARLVWAPSQSTVICTHLSRDFNGRCRACGDVARGYTHLPWTIQSLDQPIEYTKLNPACQGGIPTWPTWTGWTTLRVASTSGATS